MTTKLPDAASEKSELSPGDMLGGKFRVERVVGRGGMGVVVEATNVQLDQKVALKLLAAGTQDPTAVERFNSEAKAAARLRSEHVARVYDVGKDTLHGPFIVMEMLEGKTLADVISGGRVLLHRAVEYLIDACEGLAEAHSRGIVHQDVKPANLFLVTGPDGRPSVKLLDFGIATIRSKEREADPKSSHPSLGTPAYLAPEQLRRSTAVTHRADIWALGCVLYELIVGERPFRAKRFTELVTKILETPPEPFPPELALPAPVANAILRCLERDPEKRFASSAELALALLPFARPRSHLAVSRAVAHVTKSGLDPELQMPSSMPPPPASSTNPEIDLPAGDQLRAPAVPRFSPGSRSGVVSSTQLPAAPSPGRSKRNLLLVAVVLAAILVGAIAAWSRTGSTPTNAPTTMASAPGVSTQSAVPPRGPTSAQEPAPAPEPKAATTPAASAAPSAAASAQGARGANGAADPAGVTTPRPQPGPKPVRPQNTAPPGKPTGESDIRFQR